MKKILLILGAIAYATFMLSVSYFLIEKGHLEWGIFMALFVVVLAIYPILPKKNEAIWMFLLFAFIFGGTTYLWAKNNSVSLGSFLLGLLGFLAFFAFGHIMATGLGTFLGRVMRIFK